MLILLLFGHGIRSQVGNMKISIKIYDEVKPTDRILLHWDNHLWPRELVTSNKIMYWVYYV